tara:strand:- start:10921 stop:11916 length:996 start_codon:yes stop_codon:yes gene_type:complete
MNLSIKKISINEKGFTLIEVIVVLAIISILSAVTFPSFFLGLKKNKFEEMKAILNQYASQCLEKYRQNEKIRKVLPDSFQGDQKIINTGYKFSDNPNCSELFVEPINTDDESLFKFGFYIGPQTGKFLSYGEPSSGIKDSLDMCYSWAGSNCNNKNKIKAFRNLEKMEREKTKCINTFLSSRNNGTNGALVTWDDEFNSCSKIVYIVDGYIYESEDEFDLMNAELSCQKWISNKENDKFTGKAKYSDCGSKSYFFYNGIEVGSRVNMDYEILKKDLKICETAIERKRINNFSGPFFFNNGKAPKGCEKVWICQKVIYKTEDAFNNSACGAQ